MIRRSHRCFITNSKNQSRAMPTKNFCQGYSNFKTVKQLSIGKTKLFAMHNTKHTGSFRCFSKSLFWTTRSWCWLTVSDINDSYSKALKTNFARVPPQPISTSSGCAPTAMTSSGSGSWSVTPYPAFVAAIRKFGLIASNRIRSICSIPRAILTIQYPASSDRLRSEA